MIAASEGDPVELVWIAIVVVFFGLSLGMIRLFERL